MFSLLFKLIVLVSNAPSGQMNATTFLHIMHNLPTATAHLWHGTLRQQTVVHRTKNAGQNLTKQENQKYLALSHGPLKSLTNLLYICQTNIFKPMEQQKSELRGNIMIYPHFGLTSCPEQFWYISLLILFSFLLQFKF